MFAFFPYVNVTLSHPACCLPPQISYESPAHSSGSMPLGRSCEYLEQEDLEGIISSEGWYSIYVLSQYEDLKVVVQCLCDSLHEGQLCSHQTG